MLSWYVSIPLLSLGLSASSGVSCQAALIIDLSFTGDAAYQPAFDNAASSLEAHLGGYQDGRLSATTMGSSYLAGEVISRVYVTANIASIDLVGSTLASAGPTEFAIDQSGFFLATNGNITVDSADIASLAASGNLEQLVTHELAHVLGFGTLWSNNSVYLNGSGEFTGANATAAWQSEFGQLGTPDVELEGGLGTAGGHWNENLDGAGLTGITDSMGRDMRDELMTGWLNPNSFISDLTVASFRDIGFTGATAVPEPGAMVFLMSLFGAYGARRYRKRAGSLTQLIRRALP